MSLTGEEANKIAQRYNSDLIAELSDEIATLQNQLSIAMSENQRLTKHVEDYEEDNATLKAKLAAIECGDCGKTMLECACDD